MQKNKQVPEAVAKVSDSLSVHSIFYTIQGEGPHAGRPAIFIRLAGCNLACPLCDTEYTSKRSPMTVPVIMDTVAEMVFPIAPLRPNLVVITGGEPMRQSIGPLCHELLRYGFDVQVETNGTLCPEGLPLPFKAFSIVCSPKLHYVNRDLEPYIAAFKYVARDMDLDPEDGLPVRALGHPLANGKKLYRPRKGATVYLQPVDEQDIHRNESNKLAVVRACMKHGYRLCLQIHKLIGVE
jgi:7-carboxy-7-deazaguanine synthase